MKKKFCPQIIITLSLFLVCFSGSCRVDKAKAINIGVILPLTGEVATYGQSVKKGLDIAIEIEESKNFKLIYEDSRANKKTAINALEKLFFSKVKYFIGDATSTVTYEIGPRIQAQNGVLIVPIATGDRIREIGENIFMMSPRNEKQTRKIANFIKERFNNKRIGCFFKQNEYGVNIANTFFKLFNESIYSQAYQEGQGDFRSSLLKFKSKGIELVFLPGNYEETATILKQAMEINYKADFIGTDGTYSPKLIELAGEASENFLLTMMPVDYNSKMYLEFEKIYYEKFKTKPDIFACYGYESGIIMMDAIKSSSQNKPEEVIRYLLSNEFNSFTGIMSFDEKGEAKRNFQIYKVENGAFIPYTY